MIIYMHVSYISNLDSWKLIYILFIRLFWKKILIKINLVKKSVDSRIIRFFLRYQSELQIKRKKTYKYILFANKTRITNYSRKKREKTPIFFFFFWSVLVFFFFFASLLYRIISELYLNHEFLIPPNQTQTIRLSLC